MMEGEGDVEKGGEKTPICGDFEFSKKLWAVKGGFGLPRSSLQGLVTPALLRTSDINDHKRCVCPLMQSG